MLPFARPISPRPTSTDRTRRSPATHPAADSSPLLKRARAVSEREPSWRCTRSRRAGTQPFRWPVRGRAHNTAPTTAMTSKQPRAIQIEPPRGYINASGNTGAAHRSPCASLTGTGQQLCCPPLFGRRAGRTPTRYRSSRLGRSRSSVPPVVAPIRGNGAQRSASGCSFSLTPQANPRFRPDSRSTDTGGADGSSPPPDTLFVQVTGLRRCFWCSHGCHPRR
jgi:hypothetical protein